MKSELMTFLEANNGFDCEGVDIYGITSKTALFSCLSWVQGPSWDGRWAIAVCSDSDMASTPDGGSQMSGAAAAAVLVGAQAPLQLSHDHVSLSAPCRTMPTRDRMAPLLYEPGLLEAHDRVVSEHPCEPGLLRASLECIASSSDTLSGVQAVSSFERKAAPSLLLTSLIGPCPSASALIELVASSVLGSQAAPQRTSLRVLSSGLSLASKAVTVRTVGSIGAGSLPSRQGTQDSLKPLVFMTHRLMHAGIRARFGRKVRVLGSQPVDGCFLSEVAAPARDGSVARGYAIKPLMRLEYAPRLVAATLPPASCPSAVGGGRGPFSFDRRP